MSDTAIRAQNLSKQYRIGGPQARYKTIRESLIQAVQAPFRRLASVARGQSSTVSYETIWALKDVSFEVQHGEVVGIIGRNGAGKTTLLKVLSRITEPTEGLAEIHGRVGSLLEVGTGFHPELTGRENIYLNGAILGMKRAEIDRKFDEIVEFAEIEKFLDTPAKHYSSGMYVRLAFAVAAHLEPEILLVDEVLAVGDAAFQKKCLGKMGDVAKEGRTVLLVSHQMNSIRRLSERCIWLDVGRIQMVDSAVNVVSAYQASLREASYNDARRAEDSHAHARFLRWEILEPKTEQPNLLTTLGPVTFKFVVRVNRPIRHGGHGIALWDTEKKLIWGNAAYSLKLDPGVHEFLYTLDTLPLRPGVYYWYVSLYEGEGLLDIWNGVPELVIGTEPLTHPRDKWSGILNTPCEFRVNHLE
jgi:lipopolysaccharide transport system ATP-binding protein